ncbi:MAG: hypothetical protein QW620_08120 [Thermoplasmata archaeon]
MRGKYLYAAKILSEVLLAHIRETLDYRACSNLDSDFDGLSNHVEVLLGTNLNDADTDDDGLSDAIEGAKRPELHSAHCPNI